MGKNEKGYVAKVKGKTMPDMMVVHICEANGKQSNNNIIIIIIRHIIIMILYVNDI